MPSRKLKTITLEQRLALRQFSQQNYPRPSQKACGIWFFDKYNIRLSQSTISESLSSRFESLDKAPTSSFPRLKGSRQRAVAWPEIELILFEWQKQIEAKGGVTSGEILQEKAKQIWKSLPQYSQQSMPEFSLGWISKFKARHQIKSQTRQGEIGSVPIHSEEEMKAIQTIAGEYQEEDIYNMDETGLYWKMSISRGLLTQQQQQHSGFKKEKDRVSIAFCVNCTGSDRLPPWIIGKSKQPRALRNIDVTAMGGVWKYNKKAWMNQFIMAEWLTAFYHHIGSTRSILLTMDNFSAHIAGLELSPPPQNIRIIWLPPNATSRYQALDQGIISTFKAYYRRQWLQFMLEEYELDRNPIKTMNIHLAIRWLLRSWNLDIQNTTIYNCFRKSTILQRPIQLPLPPPPKIDHLYQQVQQAGFIHDAMEISNFLNPIEEDIQDNDNDLSGDGILSDLMAQYIPDSVAQDDDDDDAQIMQPVLTTQAALQAIKSLIEFIESGNSGINEAPLFLRSFERFERHLQLQFQTEQVQGTLDRWIQ